MIISTCLLEKNDVRLIAHWQFAPLLDLSEDMVMSWVKNVNHELGKNVTLSCFLQ